MRDNCPICHEPYDALGLCDPNCPVMIAQDDQLRAEVAELNKLPDPDPELTRRLIHNGMKRVRLLLWRQRMALP